VKTLQNPDPVTFRHSQHHQQWRLTTDASETGWGAILEKRGVREWWQVLTMQNIWPPSEAREHITKLEALATKKACKIILPHLKAGDHLHILTDASSTSWAWNKGTKNQAMNNIITPTWHMLQRKGVHTTADHIKGQLNTHADWLSRKQDPKNYQLNPQIFHHMCKAFHFKPQWDLFASHKNKQVKKYCSWHHDGHRDNLGNAWDLTWNQPAWLNPPWELIHPALKKLHQDRTTALVCLPVWPSAGWWRFMVSMIAATPIIMANTPMYKDPQGQPLPSPRWATLFTVLQG